MRVLQANDPIEEETEGGPSARYPRLTVAGEGLLNLRVSDRTGYWFASSASPLDRFGSGDRLGRDRLLVTDEIPTEFREYLEALFQDVVTGPPASFLPLEEVREVLASDTRQDLLLGVLVSVEPKALVLIRGNLDRLVVPWSWFRPTPSGLAPDFTDVEVIDSGLTIRAGQYEAAVDAVLYEFDRDYRARERQRRLEIDTSFGAALRRLRLQKRVSRSEFTGISEKEIARIERGEVERPHGSTLRAIADRLGVAPAAIETY